MDAPEVTPQMQAAFRTSRKKTLKKGRKSRKGKTNGQKDGKTKGRKSRKTTKEPKGASPIKPSHKREILKSKSRSSKDLKVKGGSKCPKTKDVALPAEPKAKARSKKNQKNDDKPAESTRHSQKRMELGDGRWMYEVLEGQTFGCTNCRCIYNGCKICKRPGFGGKSAAFFRQYQQQQCSTNDPETNCREAEEPQVKKPKRKAKNDGKEGGKSRKSKKD